MNSFVSVTVCKLNKPGRLYLLSNRTYPQDIIDNITDEISDIRMIYLFLTVESLSLFMRLKPF